MRKDVLGDLPNYDEMSLDEYLSQYWYWKWEVDPSTGLRKKAPSHMKASLAFQDGNCRGRTKKTGDALSSALDKLASSEKSLLKVVTPEMLDKVHKQAKACIWAEEYPKVSDLITDMMALATEKQKQAWVQACKKKIEKLDKLEPEVDAWLNKRNMMALEVLFGRVVAYADAVNKAAGEKKGDDLFQFRVVKNQELLVKVQKVMDVPESWYLPRAVASYIGQLYWARVTNKLHTDPEKAVEEMWQDHPAVVGCMTRYVWALVREIHMERRSEQNHVDNLLW